MTDLHPERDLGGFTGNGYDKGRSRGHQILWFVASHLVFQKWWCPNRLRVRILRSFGASVGTNVVIRQRVRVHWPWKLSIGDNTWIGESAWLLNLEPIIIGRNSCISQDVLLCTGSHDRSSPTFEFDNRPIYIGDGVWIATKATVLRGVRVGDRTTIGAGSLVTRDVAPDQVLVAPSSILASNR